MAVLNSTLYALFLCSSFWIRGGYTGVSAWRDILKNVSEQKLRAAIEVRYNNHEDLFSWGLLWTLIILGNGILMFKHLVLFVLTHRPAFFFPFKMKQTGFQVDLYQIFTFACFFTCGSRNVLCFRQLSSFTTSNVLYFLWTAIHDDALIQTAVITTYLCLLTSVLSVVVIVSTKNHGSLLALYFKYTGTFVL